MSPSERITSEIRRHTLKLARFHDRILGCHVSVEAFHQQGAHETDYRVRIDLTAPGNGVVVERYSSEILDFKNVQLFIMIGQVFEDAERQLEDFIRRSRVRLKIHGPTRHAHVLRIFPEAGYGFLETADGREVYFHRNSVPGGGFERLRTGAEVTFEEMLGDKEPRVCTVRPFGRHALY